MEKEPYYYPPLFQQECNKGHRKKLFRKYYPEHDCVLDPFYPERKQIYDAIRSNFETKLSLNEADERQNWKESMQQVYQQYHIKTPYNFYDKLISDVYKILASDKNNKGDILFLYMQLTYRKEFASDPFYTFYSILDFLLFELINGKHETIKKKTIDLFISDGDLVKFIYLLIVNSFIGITQFRFIIYMSILNRGTDILRLLLSLIDFLEIPLTKNIGDNSLKVKVLKRLLLIDALEFSFVQLRFEIVEFLVEECGVPLSAINHKVLESLRNREELQSIQQKYSKKDARLIKKFYTDYVPT